RSAESDADIVILERARIEGVRARAGADEVVVARIVKHRTAELVGSALGDHVDAGAHEIALTHVVRRDVHLELLKGVQRNGSHAGTVTGLPRQPERVVEVRPVDRHVVESVVLTGERKPKGHGTVLRREPEQVLDPTADGRQVVYLRGGNGGRGSGP